MSASIAAYKTCSVLSQLVQQGHHVQVVATPNTLAFIGPATLEGLTGRPILTDTFMQGHAMDHIHLIRDADLILLCPASANTLNQMAHGLASNLVTTLFLAHDFKKPFLVAPAMNTAMIKHPITQSSLKTLSSLGITVLGTGAGKLACGETGEGRLLEPDEILKQIDLHLRQKPIRPKILITSGGTQEAIDSMRVLTNLSTGQTGAKMAEALSAAGFEVHYVGATNARRPHFDGLDFSFSSFESLDKILQQLLADHSYLGVIHAAAVSDFHVSKIWSGTNTFKDPSPSLTNPLVTSMAPSAGELVSQDGPGDGPVEDPLKSAKGVFSGKLSSQSPLTIELSPNFKILPRLKTYAKKGSPKIIGFKFTATTDLSKRKGAVDKLFEEGAVDQVVHNDQLNIDKAKGLHRFTVYSPSTSQDLESPAALAHFFIQYFNHESNKGVTTL